MLLQFNIPSFCETSQKEFNSEKELFIIILHKTKRNLWTSHIWIDKLLIQAGDFDMRVYIKLEMIYFKSHEIDSEFHWKEYLFNLNIFWLPHGPVCS